MSAIPPIDRAESYDCENSQNTDTRLGAILERLPLAVGLFDLNGRFVIRSGALRTVWGDHIPSRDPEMRTRWQVLNSEGLQVDPSEYPGARVLRGETVIPGVAAAYNVGNGQMRYLRVNAAPYSEKGGFTGGIVLMQDIDEETRARDNLRDELEVRYVETLMGTLRTASKDSNYFEQGVAHAFIARTLGFPVEGRGAPPEGLTNRELEVLKLIAWGKSYKQISAVLGISIKTVDFHRSGAMTKLRLRNRTEIIRYALNIGWLRKTPR